MSAKAIEFETIKEICRHKNGKKCSEEDNITGICDRAECPIWCDLTTSDIEE